jgi:hypothetical protein
MRPPIRRWFVPVAVMGSLLTVWGGAGIVSAQTSKSAAGAGSPMMSSGKVAEQPSAPVVTGRKLKTTAISQDGGTVTVGSGFQPIDGVTTLVCPGTSGNCTIEADQHVQVSGSTANNAWAICTQVDGAFMNQPVCPYQGYVPNGSYGTGSFAQFKTSVPFGNHTVQTFLYTSYGATRNIYSITYRVYKP